MKNQKGGHNVIGNFNLQIRNWNQKRAASGWEEKIKVVVKRLINMTKDEKEKCN